MRCGTRYGAFDVPGRSAGDAIIRSRDIFLQRSGNAAGDALEMFQPSGLSVPRSVHQRVDGAARLAYACDARGTTRLADLYQRAPCRILFPDVEDGEPVQAVLLTTSGGLTGGDRLAVDVHAGSGVRVTVATQAAEKLYRALPVDGPARIDVRIRVGAGAWLEWLAQETILFEGSSLRRHLFADLEPGARLLAVESVVFGRAAMGETFASGLLHDAWRIRREGRLAWADALHLEGDVARQRTRPFGFGTACACATVVYAGADAGTFLEPLRERLDGLAARMGATCLDGLLIARVLADDDSDLRTAVRRVAGALRSLAGGLGERLPKVWNC